MDYYNERFSYIKLVVESLIKYGIEIDEKLIGEVFNGVISLYPEVNRGKVLIESSFVGALLERKMKLLTDAEKEKNFLWIYNDYIAPLIPLYTYNNQYALMDCLDNSLFAMKSQVGYYGIYGMNEDEVIADSVSARRMVA